MKTLGKIRHKINIEKMFERKVLTIKDGYVDKPFYLNIGLIPLDEIKRNMPFAWVMQCENYQSDDIEYTLERLVVLFDEIRHYMLHYHSKDKLVIYVEGLYRIVDTIQSLILPFKPEWNSEGRCYKATHNNIELRDATYILGGFASLNMWAKQLGVDCPAQILPASYGKVKPEHLANLSDRCDAFRECVEKTMEIENDTISTMPVTRSQYVRRRLLNSLPVLDIKEDLQYPMYMMLKGAFRGGNVIATELNILHYNAYSYDVTSEYPGLLLRKKFPVGEWFNAGDNPDWLLDTAEVPWIGIVQVTNLKYKNPGIIGLIDRYSTLDEIERAETSPDNAKIYGAKSITLFATDVDYKAIKKHYKTGTVHLLNAYYNDRYDYLPDGIAETVLYYYNLKMQIKDHNSPEYALTKALLNSIAGNLQRDPIVGKIEYEKKTGRFANTRKPEEVVWFKKDSGYVVRAEKYAEYEAILNGYYKGKFQKHNHKLPFWWGVWLTAYGREQLQQMIDAVGYGLLYADTDGVKATTPVDWTEYNNAIIKEQTEALEKTGWKIEAPTDQWPGVVKTEWQAEEFVTWGNKQYAYKVDGRWTATMSGLNKKAFSAELNRSDINQIIKEIKEKGYYTPETKMIAKIPYKGEVIYKGYTLRGAGSYFTKKDYKIRANRDWIDDNSGPGKLENDEMMEIIRNATIRL